ncbi:hypothetical protein IP69_09880 [Bosea sp. AAP35]|uniref:PIN-like domain-containing protein n=1 Tax=Bosea sp. AAP35 TaxID=1523417 RepID=UPI0006CDDD47|nr:hypothetical protein [Bosea sp. AAP35]KPF70164.1 hypothetical protein IP69_09880 [Bosea sp. AAP35]
MRVFFDNCTSPVLADVLNAYIRSYGGSARHIRDMTDYGLQHSSTDGEWIERLSLDRPADWVVVTNDAQIRRNQANRAAWLRAGLKGFVFASGFQKMPMNEWASTLIWRWPEMESFVRSAAPRALFELPVRRAAGFRPLTV